MDVLRLCPEESTATVLDISCSAHHVGSLSHFGEPAEFWGKNDVFLWWIRDLSEKPTKKWPTKASNGDKSKLARHELPNSQAWNPSESLRDLWEAYRYPSDLGKSHGNFPWIFSNLKHSQAIGWVNPDYWASYPRIDKIVIKYDQVLISPEIDYVTFKIWEKN